MSRLISSPSMTVFICNHRLDNVPGKELYGIALLGEDKNDPNLSESSKVATYIDYIWDKGLRLSKKHR